MFLNVFTHVFRCHCTDWKNIHMMLEVKSILTSLLSYGEQKNQSPEEVKISSLVL